MRRLFGHAIAHGRCWPKLAERVGVSQHHLSFESPPHHHTTEKPAHLSSCSPVPRKKASKQSASGNRSSKPFRLEHTSQDPSGSWKGTLNLVASVQRQTRSGAGAQQRTRLSQAHLELSPCGCRMYTTLLLPLPLAPRFQDVKDFLSGIF